jgi:uncharacterized protein YprB with RNaseH-like and TPR domain
MAERSLRDRLVELRRPGATPPAAASGAAAAAPPPPELQAPASLDELEVRLLGATGDGLPLKERLERLVGAATARDRARTPPPQRLSEIVRGDRVANERGEFFQMEHSLHVESLHGGVSLSRLRSVSPSTVAILAGEPGFEAFELGGSAFLDTETTGLSGGAGTAAFLVGLGFVDGDAFRVRQYFMEDYDQEAALLHQLAADLRRFPRLVTFNGKMFDVPLLETRYRLSRGRWPLEDAPHLDLLHPARRLWKARLESCRLVHLETELLRLRREEDIPGDQIPQVYFDYLRSRDARVLPRIFEHNRLDVVSLAALAVLACQWVESGHMDDPRDAYSLARVFDRAELRERSEAHYRAAAERGEGAVRVRSLLEIAARSRRAGDLDAAVAHWQAAVDEGSPDAARQLAVHLEHRARDLEAALRVAEQGLALAADGPMALLQDFLKRRERLKGRIVRRGAGSGDLGAEKVDDLLDDDGFGEDGGA